MKTSTFIAAAALLVPSLVGAQPMEGDVADNALLSTFTRDSARFVCVTKSMSLKEMRSELAPYIKGVDTTKDENFPTIARAIYEAFPCPFSPARQEIARATRENLTGRWIFPPESVRLRHGPKSPAWTPSPGVPPIKCEAVIFRADGAYRVAQIRGQYECPDGKLAGQMEALPQVQSWSLSEDRKVRISRSDVPAHSEEWDYFVVAAPFVHGGVQFAPGDLLGYLRREPGNQINAVTTFRHLQPLK